MVVPHKEAFEAAELHHPLDEIALFLLGIAEILILFTHETEMICRTFLAAVALLPSLLELLGRDVEKGEGGDDAPLRGIFADHLLVPVDLIVVDGVETAEKGAARIHIAVHHHQHHDGLAVCGLEAHRMVAHTRESGVALFKQTGLQRHIIVR